MTFNLLVHWYTDELLLPKIVVNRYNRLSHFSQEDQSQGGQRASRDLSIHKGDARRIFREPYKPPRVGWDGMGWDGVGAIEGDVWIGSGRMSSKLKPDMVFFKA